MSVAMAVALENALDLARRQATESDMQKPGPRTVVLDFFSQDELDKMDDQDTEEYLLKQEKDKRCPIPLALWAAA